jgi:hypothetical protein
MSPRELESGREGSDRRVFWLTVCDALRADEGRVQSVALRRRQQGVGRKSPDAQAWSGEAAPSIHQLQVTDFAVIS